MSKFQNFQQIFEVVKLAQLCSRYTAIDPRAGLYHRLKGYDTNKKAAALTEDDAAQLKAGILGLAADLVSFANKIEP